MTIPKSLNIKLPSRFRTLSIFCLMSFNMIMNKPLKTDYQHRSGSKIVYASTFAISSHFYGTYITLFRQAR